MQIRTYLIRSLPSFTHHFDGYARQYCAVHVESGPVIQAVNDTFSS